MSQGSHICRELHYIFNTFPEGHAWERLVIIDTWVYCQHHYIGMLAESSIIWRCPSITIRRRRENVTSFSTYHNTSSSSSTELLTVTLLCFYLFSDLLINDNLYFLYYYFILIIVIWFPLKVKFCLFLQKLVLYFYPLYLYIFVCVSEPNANKPKITAHRLNEHGRPEIHGIIREDETEVTLQNPLTATDDDTLGGACEWFV